MSSFRGRCNECGRVCDVCKARYDDAVEKHNKLDPDTCEKCVKNFSNPIDRIIYHKNGHMWPGFAGDP